MQCIVGIDVFVEKPLSLVPPEEFNQYELAIYKAQLETKAIISVGYMFRYKSHLCLLAFCCLIFDQPSK